MNADGGFVDLTDGNLTSLIDAAKQHRIWDREPSIRAF